MVAPPKTEPRFWTYRDAAAATQLCMRTLERHVAEGNLPVVRVGRNVRFRPSDVMAWMESYAQKPEAK